jgi:hypothetical protein
MDYPNAQRIAQLISDTDAREQKLLDRGLRTNETLGHDRNTIAHLIELELVYANGMAVRVTDLGYEVLKLVP